MLLLGRVEAGGYLHVTGRLKEMIVLGGGKNIMGAMYKGFLVTAVLSVPAIWWAIGHALGGMEEMGRGRRRGAAGGGAPRVATMRGPSVDVKSAESASSKSTD